MRRHIARLSLFIAFIGVSMAFTHAASVQAASFDCAKAQSKVEKMICDPKDFLSQMDEDLDAAYRWALMRVENKQQVVAEQRHWLKTVRNTCKDARCLQLAYESRLDELAAQARNKGCYVLMPIYDEGARGNPEPIEPVCLALEKNFNQFCDQPPMACGLKIAPEFKDRITLPEWTPLDAEANKALIEEFIRAPWQNVTDKYADKNTDNRKWEEVRPDIEKAFAEKRLTFSRARLDLYNLGEAQLAYRFDYGDCIANNPQLSYKNRWDEAIHYANVKIQHAPNVIRALFKQYFQLGDFTLNEVFLFDGKTYSFVMGGADRVIGETVPGKYEPRADNELWVNRHERWTNSGNKKIGLSMNNICKFTYQPLQGELQ